MIVSYREYLVPGALIALEIIEAAAMIGVGRFGLDVLFIVAGGVLVVVLKQALFHRRQPMV